MKQLTLRGFEPELEREIERVADEYGISLNQAVLRLLRRGAGLEARGPHRKTVGAALDRHFGTWSESDAKEFDEAVAVFDQIDEELWR